VTARFEGMTVLVTGATGGFGRRAAKRFAEEGASLVLSDRDPATLDDLARSLDAKTATLSGDIADEKLSSGLVALALDTFGRLDIALNNAGIAHDFARLPDIPTEEARHVINVDLMGVFHAMKAQLTVMERQFRETGKGGAIVNMASVAALAGAPRLSVYAAAKHGVVGLTRSAAVEFAGKGVRINCICPSYARTPMADALLASPWGREKTEADLTRGVPMRRLAEVDEVVEAILFAADPRNSFMTGQAIAIDGGITAI
jgi:NAD(P)-dependent dehydrogenase (short-subunit alcohol dehydrogenase family)